MIYPQQLQHATGEMDTPVSIVFFVADDGRRGASRHLRIMLRSSFEGWRPASGAAASNPSGRAKIIGLGVILFELCC